MDDETNADAAPESPSNSALTKRKSLYNVDKDSLEAENPKTDAVATWWNIWALGITIVIGGQYFSWNVGLQSGLGSFLVGFFVIALAYIIHCCCVSEMTSCLPFAGGAYGLARCSLGFYWGYIIGTSESLQYIFYVASSVTSLAGMITSMYPSLLGHEPLIWFLFYMTAVPIHVLGGKYFWRIVFVFAIISILPVIVFTFGSLPFVDFTKYAPHVTSTTRSDENMLFIDGMAGFLKALPNIPWLFVGVEGLNMASSDAKEPTTTIPFGQMSCVLTLFVTALMVSFVAVSLPQTDVPLSENLTPFNVGFRLMFNTASPLITWLSIPATYATAFGFIYAYGRLLAAMADSNLYPSILTARHSKTQAPWAAIVAGSLISYFVCLVASCWPAFASSLYYICILGAFVAYAAQGVSYIFVHTQLTAARKFASPFGLFGAIYCLFVWTFGIVGVVAFQNDHQFALIFFICMLTCLTVYYYAVAKQKQTMSADEQQIMFRVHVIVNAAKKRNRNKKKKVKPPSDSSKRRTSSNGSNSGKGQQWFHLSSILRKVAPAGIAVINESKSVSDGVTSASQNVPNVHEG